MNFSRPSIAVFLALSIAACKGTDASTKATPVSSEHTPAASSSSSTVASASPVPSAIASTITLPGVDTAKLAPREQAEFAKEVQTLLSPCGDPITLARCVSEKRACVACVPAASFIADAVTHGAESVEIRAWYTARFDPASVKAIPAGDSPSIGPADAPITLIEFLDFECPHCAAATPLVRAVVSELAYASSVRVVFKMYPLTSHTHAKQAAIAGIAAAMQGKFLPMEEQLFTHQDKLEESDLPKYAAAAGCDLAKWKGDLAAAATKVEDDLKLGNDLKLLGVPSIFIDGREFVAVGDLPFEDQLRGWLSLEQQINAPK